MKRRKFWVDVTEVGNVGIECDDPEFTFDGEYACVCGRLNDANMERAQKLVEVLNMYLPPKREKRP